MRCNDIIKGLKSFFYVEIWYLQQDIETKFSEDIEMEHWLKMGEATYSTNLMVKTNQNRVKSVRIRSYSGPHFPAFGLNAERYVVQITIL